MTRNRYEDLAYAALRIVFGALFVCHGLAHVFGLLVPQAHAAVGSQMWIGGVIELVCGAAIALGLFTRIAAFLACGEMAVAYFQFHWKLKFAHLMFLPIVNHGELAVLYCFAFLFVLARGGGRFSLDGALRGAT